MAGIKRRLGSLLGPTGREPQLSQGSTTQVDAGTPAQISLVKTGEARYRVDARIPRGPDGDGTGADDQSVASHINTQGTATQTAFINQTKSVVFDVPGPTGSEASDKAVVVAACQKAVDEGRNIVTLGPGYYDLTDFTVDDILGRYLVGDNVEFSLESDIYPFKPDETIITAPRAYTSGGRGAIAFEVDDSQQSHWNKLFPLSKELGVPMASAWHTDWAPWMKEAVRHGWEAMSHLPNNYRATELTLEQLDAYAKETVDWLEWATGTRDGHGFVYPQHYRNDETDRILSKYFSRGRAGTDGVPYPMDAPNPWGYHVYSIDDRIMDGLDLRLKETLDSIAASNSKMVFLSHWRIETADQLEVGFRELIAYARNLGIDIVLPRQLMTRSQVIPDPYFQTDNWVTLPGFSEEEAYHGTRSVKFSHDMTGDRSVQKANIALATRPGMFTVIRPSIRIKSWEAEFVSADHGLHLNFVLWRRDTEGWTENFEHYRAYPNLMTPGNGGNLPDLAWHRVRRVYYLPPHVQKFRVDLNPDPLLEGELWVDEFQMDVVDYVPELVFDGTTHPTDGTLNTWNRVPIIGVDRIKAEVETIDSFIGDTTLELGADGMKLQSTAAEDANKRFRVRFIPMRDYTNVEWTQEGA